MQLVRSGKCVFDSSSEPLALPHYTDHRVQSGGVVSFEVQATTSAAQDSNQLWYNIVPKYETTNSSLLLSEIAILRFISLK